MVFHPCSSHASKGGNSPLHMACEVGHMEVLHALLSRGAKVELQTKDGATPLYVACLKGHAEEVRALLSAGAEVDLQEKVGFSLLHVACGVGLTEVVRALLSGGAKVDLQTRGGLSPLHVACLQGHVVVVRALLSAGARADLHDFDGTTPPDLLPRALHAEVERLLQQAKEVRGSARADESRVGAPSATAAVLPPAQSACQLQAPSEDGGEGSSEGPGGLSAEASSVSGRAASGRVCSMCGGSPSASASSGGVAKLKACGHCMSMRYCSQDCQKKHWGGGGHKAACPQLRQQRKGVKVELQEPT